VNCYTITDEERQWLVDLNEALWPKSHTSTNPNIRYRISMEALRPLTTEELGRVEAIILERGLMTSMFSTSMFGGYGMDVYEHEPTPGIGPLHLLRLVEGHMPEPTPEQTAVDPGRHQRPGGGVGRQDAWECFSKHTHSERNAGWLTSYKMRPPQSRSHYDY
jgi:hypothetical protein